MNFEKRKMTNLLLIYENKIATVELLSKTFEEYERKSSFSVTMEKAVSLRIQDIINTDIIFLIRPNYYLAYQVGKIGLKLGKYIIVYCDDDLLNIKKSYHDLIWRKKSLVRLLNISNVFCSPNKSIIEKYQIFMSRSKAFIFDTPVEKEDINIKKFSIDYFEKNPVKILYAASQAHKIFFEYYIGPILDQIVERYGKRISFTFIGVKPKINYEIIQKGNFKFYNGMPLSEYRKFVNSGNFDIGLAPLEISEFTKCKYFNKYLEYSMSGIMGIYTKSEPYTDIIVNGINGILVENDTEKWFDALCLAIDDASLRAKIISNAQNHIIDKFNPDTLYEKFVTEILECTPYKANKTIKSIGKYGIFLLLAKVIYTFERIGEMIYKAFQTYKLEGSEGIKKKIKHHINKGGDN